MLGPGDEEVAVFERIRGQHAQHAAVFDHRPDQHEPPVQPAADDPQPVSAAFADERPRVPAPVETREQARVLQALPQRIPWLSKGLEPLDSVTVEKAGTDGFIDGELPERLSSKSGKQFLSQRIIARMRTRGSAHEQRALATDAVFDVRRLPAPR